MSNPLNRLYEFGSFRLDTESGTLWRGNDVIPISPKAAEVLKLLVSKEGQVVSKKEIFDSVWADTFVEDGVLTQNIYTLRHALGLDSSGKQFIETVPRRGYRFAETVTALPIAGTREEELRVEERDRNGNSSSVHSPTADHDSATNLLSPARSKSDRSRTFAIVAVLAIAAVALGGVGVYQFTSRGAEERESTIAPIEQVRFQSLTDTGDIIHPTISPDGEFLAFVRLEGDQSSVWVKQIATGSDIQILPPSKKGYRSLAFSSDGSYLFFRDEADPGSIHQTTHLGGAIKKVADNAWSDFSVSPDNTQFAFVRRDAARNAHLLMLSNTADGGERVLAVRQPPHGYRGAAPAWSPDGKKLVVAVASATQARPLLTEVDVATGEETELTTPNFREITRILWTPDSKKLIVAARLMTEATSQIWTISTSDGELRRLTNDLEAYFWLSLSGDGKTLVARQQRVTSHLWLLPNGDLKQARQLTFGSRTLDGYVGLAWTQDGRILFSSRSGDVTDLYSMTPDGNDRSQLTTNAGTDNTWPISTHDGRYVLFVSSRTGAREVWRMDSDGGNPKRLTVGNATTESAYAAAPSADGREVYFIKVGAQPSAIWKIGIDGERVEQVSKLDKATAENFLAVSPDGKWIAYQHVADVRSNKGEEGTVQIGVVAADGSGEPKLFDVPVRRPVFYWTSNETFDYAAGSFNASSIWRQSLKGDAKKLIEFPDRIFNFAWSNDGTDLVVSRGRLLGDAVLISNLP
jgi:Tol biopolymer transport system component/DNA-binding winged helix-turn-helix (wHTH) protein